jgi:DNA-binding Lrp family transcriptional regulator
MTFIGVVEMEPERTDEIDAFRRKAGREPRIQQSHHITGDCDFILIALAREMDDYEQLV